MSKRKPYQFAKDRTEQFQWRSLAEHADSKAYAAKLAAEFPDGQAEPPDGVSRRDFFTVMGASLAMAGLAGCRRPEEKIVPYVHTPEDVLLGDRQYFATAMPFHGTAIGLLVESHEGRPTKIEGNPRHPDSQGAVSTYVQASILDMYDPDRSDAPTFKGEAKTWDDASTALQNLGRTLRSRQGAGLAIVMEEHRSPTLSAILGAIKQVYPQARLIRYDAFSRQTQRDGARAAFGKVLEPVLDVSKAKVLVTLDADIFATDGSVVKNARGWAAGRRIEDDKGTVDAANLSRFYAVESAFTVTGGNADHRLRLASKDIPAFTFALAKELATAGVAIAPEVVAAVTEKAGTLSDVAKKHVAAIAKDLAAHRGAGLVVAGSRQAPAVHAVTYLINVALGNTGNTIHHVKAFDETSGSPQGLFDLGAAIRGGTIDTVLILGGNPVFNGPADAMLADTLPQAANTIHLATHANETSAACQWHLNQAHYLESWSDVAAEDGTVSIVQPLIAPLYDGRTEAEVLALLLGRAVKAYDLIRLQYQGGPAPTPDFEKKWRRWLHEGMIDGSAYEKAVPAPVPPAAADAIRRFAPLPDGVEATFMPDSHAWDGKFANIGWMQEFPDPVNKWTWGSVALMSKATAAKLDVKEGHLVSVTVKDAPSSWMTVNLPVLVSPGHADDSIGVMIGQGRTLGRVAKGVGVNTTSIRISGAFGMAPVVVAKVGGVRHEPARTQEHFSMEGRAFAREATVDRYLKDRDVIKEMTERPAKLSLWDDYEYTGHRWGMAIDLNTCIGCGGCMIACQAENNIPVVGIDGVRRTREMHWIRVDRYFQGSPEDPTSITQPMSCQQCENAPCETVCPVGATTHSPEGLNDMAYNRCVGTRYCSNNCPWKVRRFNFFHYNKHHSEQRKMQFNPEVTVRSRGVMEKCTWCVQRIQRAKIAGHRAGTDVIADGTITPACAQACPTQAITFGDLADDKARVTTQQALPRSYKSLEELNTRPRMSYLAKIRNPNPELA